MDAPSNTQFIDAPEDGPVGPKHVELSKHTVNKYSTITKVVILLDYICNITGVWFDAFSVPNVNSLFSKLAFTQKVPLKKNFENFVTRT